MDEIMKVEIMTSFDQKMTEVIGSATQNSKQTTACSRNHGDIVLQQDISTKYNSVLKRQSTFQSKNNDRKSYSKSKGVNSINSINKKTDLRGTYFDKIILSPKMNSQINNYFHNTSQRREENLKK